MKPFRERNPVPIGITGLAVTAGLVFAAFHAQDLPIIGGGTTYSADFSESGDLQPGNEVRIAGVKVGTVNSVGLAGDHVHVTFRVDDGTVLGDATRAAIKLKTVVGARYLEVDPDGPGQMSPSQTIPVSRTTAPFTIDKALGGLASRVDAIDSAQLAQAFDTISDTFKDTPGLNKAALQGLSRLSQTVTKRDAELKSLLAHTQDVVKTVNSRDQQLSTLISDADVLLQALQARRQLIDEVLVHTSDLAQQLDGLAKDNTAVLARSLGKVNQVLATLQQNKSSLDRSIQLLAPYSRLFTNTLGNGRWFDTLLYNVAALNPNPTAVVCGLAGTTVNGQPAAGPLTGTVASLCSAGGASATSSRASAPSSPTPAPSGGSK